MTNLTNYRNIKTLNIFILYTKEWSVGRWIVCFKEISE